MRRRNSGRFHVGFADVLVLAMITLQVFLTPYTKVEESFNLQATHDLMYRGFNLKAFDHRSFPGVVPRTFAGPIVLSIASYPTVVALHTLGFSKVAALHCVRLVLGLLSWLCWLRLSMAVRGVLGPQVATAAGLITATQFHLPFYMSRTLPNVLAAGPVALACAHWLDGTAAWTVPALLAATAVTVRCDMLLLAATVSLELLWSRRLGLRAIALSGCAAAAGALAASVAVDSVFWGRWLWPEGEVLWFNTVLNRSREWGVMPWHWYISSALPRSLLAALPLSVAGIVVERRVRPYMAAVALFVVLYSILGHKELRFLLPVLPMFNVSAACAVARLCAKMSKSFGRRCLGAAAATAVVSSLAATWVFSRAASHNYPGGVALTWLHEHQPVKGNVSVHLDSYACMTGISQFLQTRKSWTYSKNEDISHQNLVEQNFTFLIASSAHIPRYKQIHAVYAFAGVAVQSPLVTLKLKPHVYIHELVASPPSERVTPCNEDLDET